MRARRQALVAGLALAFGAAPAGAQEKAEPGWSLIVGEGARYEVIGSPPCAENEICINAIALVRMRQVHTISGPRIPDNAQVVVEIHAPPVSGFLPAFYVRPGADGRYEGYRARVGRPGSEQCLSNDDLAHFGIPRWRESWRKGEETCFIL